MALKVRDAMAKAIGVASRTDTVTRAADLMREEGAGFIPVCDGDRLVGVVTDRDIVVRCIAEGHGDPATETLEHVITQYPLTIAPDADIEEAAELMGRAQIRRLAVVDGGKLVGVLSHGNLVQATKGGDSAEQATLGVTRGA